jgi:POT family proton-dependent oligopeptide transporter
MAGKDRKSVLWLLSTTFVITIGELYLSPIGLSLVTKVAPARIVSMMMGVWFLSSFFGNYLSGFLGTFWEKMPREAFFSLLSVLGIAAAWRSDLSKPLKAAVACMNRAPATSARAYLRYTRAGRGQSGCFVDEVLCQAP